jgi:class 3 adenylate cyclase
VFVAHDGRVVSGINLGDGFIGLFPTTVQAIAAARRCAQSSETTGLHLHLGITRGEIIVDGSRIFGGPVNYAARISALSGPDEVLVSAAVRRDAEALPEVAFVDRGAHQLKGFVGPQVVYGLVADASLTQIA